MCVFHEARKIHILFLIDVLNPLKTGFQFIKENFWASRDAFWILTTLPCTSKHMPFWCVLWHKRQRLRCAFSLEMPLLFMKYSNSLTILNSAWVPPSPPYTWINYQVEPFTCDWQACKNSLCPFNKGRSVSDNTDILEWILKGVVSFFLLL